MNCGADHVLNVNNQQVETSSSKIVEIIGEMPEKTIDCSGFEATARLGIEVIIKVYLCNFKFVIKKK